MYDTFSSSKTAWNKVVSEPVSESFVVDIAVACSLTIFLPYVSYLDGIVIVTEPVEFLGIVTGSDIRLLSKNEAFASIVIIIS